VSGLRTTLLDIAQLHQIERAWRLERRTRMARWELVEDAVSSRNIDGQRLHMNCAPLSLDLLGPRIILKLTWNLHRMGQSGPIEAQA
jgi:hypothetical protein